MIDRGYNTSVFEQFIAAMGIDGILVVQEGTDSFGRQTQSSWFTVSGDDVAFVLRVQAFNFVQGDMANIGNLLEMQVTADKHSIRGLGDIGLHGAYIVLAIVCHDIIGSDECRHVASGFTGQEVIDFPIIRFPVGAPDGLADVARSSVVGGDDQVPNVVDLIPVLQI